MLPSILTCLRSVPEEDGVEVFNMMVLLPFMTTYVMIHSRGSLVSGLAGEARSIGRHGHLICHPLICSCGVQSRAQCMGQLDNLEELKHRIATAVLSVASEMLSHIWSEIEFRLDICCVTKEAHVKIY
jgi:hypothetical protein